MSIFYRICSIICVLGLIFYDFNESSSNTALLLGISFLILGELVDIKNKESK